MSINVKLLGFWIVRCVFIIVGLVEKIYHLRYFFGDVGDSGEWTPWVFQMRDGTCRGRRFAGSDG